MAGLRALPTLLLTGITLGGSFRILRGDPGGDTLLYVAGVLWVLPELLPLVMRTVTTFPDSAAHFLQNIGLVPATSGLSAIEAAEGREDLWIDRTLVDLSDGPLKATGRAMVELRRLLDRYPRSAEAPRLQRMLETLREERFKTPAAPPSPTLPSSP